MYSTHLNPPFPGPQVIGPRARSLGTLAEQKESLGSLNKAESESPARKQRLGPGGLGWAWGWGVGVGGLVGGIDSSFFQLEATGN